VNQVLQVTDNPATSLITISRLMEQVAYTVQKTQEAAVEAVTEAKASRQELSVFKESVADVLERQNRIDSAHVRLVREAVRMRIRHLVHRNFKKESKGAREHWKRRYFSWCYKSIHQACLVSNVLDIPSKCFEIAMNTAKSWEPAPELFDIEDDA